MNRRRVLVLAIAVAFARAAAGQPAGKVWKIGFLTLAPFPKPSADAFRKALRELGYVEGRNLVIEWRSGDGDLARLPALAAELVQLKVDVLCAAASGAIGAAQKATRTIPIVMTSTGDPVGSGFVRSLAHPGGNITGLSNMGGELGAKHVELLMSVVPGLARLGVLVTPTSTTAPAIVQHVTDAARASGLATVVREASSPQEIDAAFSTFQREKIDALVVGSAPYLSSQRDRITHLAARNRIPAIYGTRQYVDDGGLMSYGQSAGGTYARVAGYVDKIFKGANPGDLPVEQPKSFELVINQRTAKALGVRIPRETLMRADALVE